MTIEQLFSIILNRKKKKPKQSYVASLFRGGTKRIAQKVGEEAIEVILAAANKKRLTEEMADLWFNCLILLANAGITPSEVLNELEKRHQKFSEKYGNIKKK